VATIDIGWVGAATGAEIVDLAGVTDPEIAALPGGHTSKAVSGVLLTARHTDRLVLELDEQHSGEDLAFARTTEARLYADSIVARTYKTIWRSPASLPVRYVVLSRETTPPSDPSTAR
jgi:hypothetical protein